MTQSRLNDGVKPMSVSVTRQRLRPIDNWTRELLRDAALGKVTIYHINSPEPYRLSLSQWNAFRRAQHAGYVVVRRRKDSLALRNVWYAWCEIEDIPCIVVRIREKFADIHMDMITASYKLSSEHIEDLNRRVGPLVEPSYYKVWGYSSEGVYPHTRATVENAPLIAQHILDVAKKAREAVQR